MRTLALIAMISLGACSDDGSDTGTGTAPSRTELILALTGDSANGELVYLANSCGACHGGAGEGSVSLGAPPIGPPTDPTVLVENVLFGAGDMVAYGDVLSDQEVADLLAWVTGGFGAP